MSGDAEMVKPLSSPLLGSENGRDANGGMLPWYFRKRPLLVNFTLMSVCFSVNHGTVTALVALASSNLGSDLGDTQTGVLYALYTMSALFFAAGLVQKIGSKWALTSGLAMYCFYVSSFLVADKAPSIKWPAAITGAGIGGLAAGWLWTAQGSFFARTAQLYAAASGKSLLEATSWLGGFFAFFYVGLEVGFKTSSSALAHWKGNTFVYVVFTVCAVASAVGMLFVRAVPTAEETGPLNIEGVSNDKDEAEATEREDASLLRKGAHDEGSDEDDEKVAAEDDSEEPQSVWLRKASLAARLFMREPKMRLLMFLNVAFGFTAAFQNSYVNGDVVKGAIGAKNVGYMAAVTPGVATLLSLPYSWLADRIGKGPLMVVGALNYTVMALSVAFMSQKQLQDLGWGLAFLYVLGGSGRAVFESTNKATFADFFPNDLEGAFANVIVMSGGASAFAFFTFSHMSKIVKSLLTASSGIAAVFTLIWAFRIYAREQKAKENAKNTGQLGNLDSNI